MSDAASRQRADEATIYVAIEITAKWFNTVLSKERIVKLAQAIRVEVARRQSLNLDH